MSALASLVRQAAPDRYLATLFAPAASREALLSVYAFDAEISRVVDLAHDPLPGEIRLQWWRDVANGLRDGEAAGHPIASALAQTIASHNLPRSAFDAYCEARIFDFYQDVLPDKTALEAQMGATHSVMIQLAALILDKQAAASASDAAGHAGVAQAIAQVLRRLPLIRKRGQGYVPQEILDAAGLTQATFLAGDDARGADRAVAAMSALAFDHFAKARTASHGLMSSVFPALLPLAVVPRTLELAARSGGSEIASVSPMARLWDISRAALRQKL